jgi:hypothetical protein
MKRCSILARIERIKLPAPHPFIEIRHVAGVESKRPPDL